MKVLILGGGGYIGFHIGLKLKEKGHSVLLFDTGSPDSEWFPASRECSLKLWKGNILSVSDIREAILSHGAEGVVHCVSHGMSGKEQMPPFWDLTEKINVTGTHNVVNACVEIGVYTSTVNVVFGNEEIFNGDETLPYFPLHRHVDHYSRTKTIAEQIILTANNKCTLNKGTLTTCALRLAGVMGLKEKRHLPRIVGTFPILKFRYGEGSKTNFSSINNVVQGHVKALEKMEETPEIIGGQAYFINDGVPINNFEYFRPLIESLGYVYPSFVIPLWIMMIFVHILQFCHVLLSRISPMLAFSPILTPCEILKSGVTHYFKIDKATRDFGYIPEKPNDTKEIVEYFQRKMNRNKKG